MHQRDAFGPHLHRADACRGVGEDQAADTLCGVQPQPLRGDAAEREPAHMSGRRSDVIQDRQGVAAQLIEHIGSWVGWVGWVGWVAYVTTQATQATHPTQATSRGSAVAACVVANDAIDSRER